MSSPMVTLTFAGNWIGNTPVDSTLAGAFGTAAADEGATATAMALAAGEDECAATEGGGGCALSALQLRATGRGEGAEAPALSNEMVEGKEGGAEEDLDRAGFMDEAGVEQDLPASAVGEEDSLSDESAMGLAGDAASESLMETGSGCRWYRMSGYTYWQDCKHNCYRSGWHAFCKRGSTCWCSVGCAKICR